MLAGSRAIESGGWIKYKENRVSVKKYGKNVVDFVSHFKA
jgi:hypothetical protein